MNTTTVTGLLQSDTQTVSLDAPPDHVFAFLAEPENLPKWAIGFCHSIRRDGDRWIVRTAQGEIDIRYVTDRALGVIDFYLSMAPGLEAAAYSRVLPSGAGAEYVFTQFQGQGMSDEVFAGQVAALREELHILQAIVRARVSCPTAAA
jgi:hypothetical protein